MLRRSVLARRTSAEWAVRLALAVPVALLGYHGATFALAQVVVPGNPVLAHRLAPHEGRITALLAWSLAGLKASDADRVRADDLARQALRQDPTAVFALSVLGVDAQYRGDTVAARRLFAYAQRLSRRHVQAQLWLIEDAVGRGDISAALHQYDIALRTNPGSAATLFPVLATAAADPTIRSALLSTLAARPPWGDWFIGHIAANGPDPRATATLLLGLRRIGVSVPGKAQADTVNALLTAGLFDQAWAYYAQVRHGVDRRQSRGLRSADPAAPSQLDWATATDDSASSTTIEDGVVDFAVPASVGGPLLRQTQLLPPGDYRLTGYSDGLDQAEDARPYWVLTCQDGRELGRVVMPNSSATGGAFSGMFGVPPGCPLQTLTLVARPSDAMSGVSGRVDRVALAPVR